MGMWNELRKYRGLWVAVHKNKVIASGRSGKGTFKKARKTCKNPIIFQVPRREDEICIL